MCIEDYENSIEKLKLKIQKYLYLDNVSVLAGAGTSWHLGTPIIRNIPKDLKSDLEKEIQTYFDDKENPSFEDLLNCLQADRYLKIKKTAPITDIENSINKMQRWLYEKCDTEVSTIQNALDDETKKKLNCNRYFYHERFVKKLLQRPNNLKRVNLFTTNYDMAFDYALDNLGIHYINGFMGVHNRYFRPEVYDYDLYYPGQSVSGKVHRAEKVIKYYKLHGSLSWVATNPNAKNTYGISELPLNSKWDKDKKHNELLIYPCATKKSFALDLPYSELFRQFAQAIIQPQSVLICVGYSFYDEHINDIINQALSIPSFTLVIVNYSKKEDSDSPIGKLKTLDDRRIIVLPETDKEHSTFCGFVENVLPDLYEEKENEFVMETLKKLHSQDFNPNNDNEEIKE